MNKKTRVFSGIQPTGKIHIGNYTGALSTWVKEQDQFEGLYCVVDLHALTIPENVNPKILNKKIWEAVAIYLAAGLDPDKSDIFIQSMVPAHSELAWILNCVTPMGWLNRMTQFKDKMSRQQTVGTGLYTYPTLMAADILLYDAEKVPVGEDQKQHIEITRDIAIRFNKMFGDTFILPEPLINESGARIMGLDDPTMKMSKSLGEQVAGHSIGIVDDPDVIAKAIKRAKTDLGSIVDYDTAGPGVKNLLDIYQSVTKKTPEEIRSELNGKGYGQLKNTVTEAVLETLRPIRTQYLALLNDLAYLQSVVDKGAARASIIAEKKIIQVREALGINFLNQNTLDKKKEAFNLSMRHLSEVTSKTM